MPYDRPKLSKAPDVKIDAITVRDQEYFRLNHISYFMNQEVDRIDFDKKHVYSKSGRTFDYDNLVLATGLKANKPSNAGDLRGIFTIRTLEDTQNVIKYFEETKQRLATSETNKLNVVIAGGSFIAMETVCYFADKANATVMSRNKPYETAFGNLASVKIQKLHESKGVKFYINPKFSISEFSESKERPGCLGAIKLQDDSKWPVDLCIIAFGGEPVTEFLRSSPIKLTLDNYVIVDKNMRANVPNVYAVGDIAKFPRACMPGFEFTLSKHNKKLDHLNIGHWGIAGSMGRCAALSIINSEAKVVDKSKLDESNALKVVPFFWSVQYNKMVCLSIF